MKANSYFAFIVFNAFRYLYFTNGEKNLKPAISLYYQKLHNEQTKNIPYFAFNPFLFTRF